MTDLDDNAHRRSPRPVSAPISPRAPGFTVIELMIVMAIIAILAAIAIPTYRNYIARAQFSEAMSLSSGVKTAVADAYQATETLNGLNNGVDGIPDANGINGTYVDHVDVKDGVITSHFAAGSALADTVAVLRPKVSGNTLAWSCQTTAPAAKSPGQCEHMAP